MSTGIFTVLEVERREAAQWRERRLPRGKQIPRSILAPGPQASGQAFN